MYIVWVVPWMKHCVVPFACVGIGQVVYVWVSLFLFVSFFVLMLLCCHYVGEQFRAHVCVCCMDLRMLETCQNKDLLYRHPYKENSVQNRYSSIGSIVKSSIFLWRSLQMLNNSEKQFTQNANSYHLKANIEKNSGRSVFYRINRNKFTYSAIYWRDVSPWARLSYQPCAPVAHCMCQASHYR